MIATPKYAIAIIKSGDFYRYEILSDNPTLKASRGAYDTEEQALEQARIFLSEKCDR